MKYKNQDLIKNWQYNIQSIAELTKHANSKTNKKTTITAILSSTNAARLLGCKVQKIGKQKLATPRRQAIGLTAALVEAMGDNLDSLPYFLHQFYSEVLQRQDYKDAVSIAAANLKQIDYVADRHHKNTPASERKLFQVFSRDDIYRDDKRILTDVAKAVSLALINRVSGAKLTKTAGRGLYVTRDAIRDCMERPTDCSDEQLSNALILLRISRYLHLVQPDELTEAGKKLSTIIDASGHKVLNHRVYEVNDFEEADWALVQRSLRLDLNTRIGHDVLVQLLGFNYVSQYFPDLSGGVTTSVVGMMLTKINEVGDNSPIMTLKTAVDTTESISLISSSTAAKWVDQALLLRPVQATKMTTREARENGYNLEEWKAHSPAEKLIVPTTSDALLMCIERLKRANKKGVKVEQLLDD